MYAKNKVEKLKKKPRYSERFNDGSKIHNKNKKTKRQHVKEKEEDLLYEEWWFRHIFLTVFSLD